MARNGDQEGFITESTGEPPELQATSKTFRQQMLAIAAAAASMAFSVAPGFAQTARPAAPAAAAADHAGMAMGEAETKHARDTATAGSLSLATSRAAESRASHAMVKTFATFEVADEETIGDVLMSMKASPGSARGALKTPSQSEVEAMLDTAGRSELEKLNGLSGAEFDKAYVAAQLDGHRQLPRIQEDYLKVGRNREHLDVAKLARGQNREHVAILEELRKTVG